MINKIVIDQSERPIYYAEKLSKNFLEKQSLIERRNKGQYITSPAVADFMASLFFVNQQEIRILDPGAGSGLLSCALCEKIVASSYRPKFINLTLYENDLNYIPFLENSINYLKDVVESSGVKLNYIIKTEDFLISNQNAFRVYDDTNDLFENDSDKFDLIISNPPYFKLPKSDLRAKVASPVIHGQPNIYALFMAASASLLKLNGQMVFITPRSYMAGPYFELFRRKFFSIISPIQFHLFHSRKEAFSHEEVLQENLIIKGISLKKANLIQNKTIKITYSNGSADLFNFKEREINIESIIEPKHMVIGLPTSEEEENILKLFKRWHNNLKTLGLQISTGPVVPFRATSLIANNYDMSIISVPLIWMNHIKPLLLKWPINKKLEYIKVCDESIPLLLPNKNYILLRRFSAKEDDRRLVAAPYLASDFDVSLIGFENHVNYIYKPGDQLTIEEIYGLASLLNSRLFDLYFRTFNGNTQVSATELRSMPLPSMENIVEIGKKVLNNSKDIKMINSIIEHSLFEGGLN